MKRKTAVQKNIQKDAGRRNLEAEEQVVPKFPHVCTDRSCVISDIDGNLYRLDVETGKIQRVSWQS
jgi:hypothetical protein